MNSWVIPCNIKYYDVVGAFKKLKKLNWKQSSCVEEGDIIYIYIGNPIKAIMFKCRANKVDLTKRTIDDSEFILNGGNYEAYPRHMELELLHSYSPEDLSLPKLKEHGLKGNIQGPRRLSEGLLNFIESVI